MPNSVEAAQSYFHQYKDSPAEEYINARGLGPVAAKFGLGWVGSALTGHERRQGMLVIPYMRPAGGENAVATIRFRCIADECVKDENGEFYAPTRKEDHSRHKKWFGKYWGLPGDVPRLYNTPALVTASPYVVLTEGEFDAQVWDMADVPATGYQGTDAWRDHFIPPYLGYERVFIIADGDEAGIKAAEARAAQIPKSTVVSLKDGLDSNSFFHIHGRDALRGVIGL